jgi:uncharacterized membrane protein
MVNGLKRIFKSYFLTGLLVLGPLVISGFIVKVIIETTDNILVTDKWLPIPGLGILAALVIILFAGFLGKKVLGKYLFTGAGDILIKIPIIGAIYSSSKQVFEAILGGQQKKFGRVVLINYPHEKSWTLAFVTAEEVPSEVQKLVSEPLLSVYVPTTPNPTSGFYMYIPKSKALETHMEVDDAFKTILSLGLVHADEKV